MEKYFETSNVTMGGGNSDSDPFLDVLDAYLLTTSWDDQDVIVPGGFACLRKCKLREETCAVKCFCLAGNHQSQTRAFLQ